MKLAYLIEAEEKEYLGFPVQKGDKETLKMINESLAKVKANGDYDRIFKKWFGSN